MDDCRAQSHVVGVALMLGVAVLALGALTASIGAVVEENAATADATRVAAAIDEALAPVETTGANRGRIAFAEGTLYTVDRELRILDGGHTRREIAVDALVFEAGEHRATFVAGAVVRGTGPRADLVEPPPVTASRDPGVLVVGAPRLGGEVAVGGSGGTAVTLWTNVSHERVYLGDGQYRLAIETATPAPLEADLNDEGARVTRRDLDGDGVPSVVARFPGRREAYLVIHDMSLEVKL